MSHLNERNPPIETEKDAENQASANTSSRKQYMSCSSSSSSEELDELSLRVRALLAESDEESLSEEKSSKKDSNIKGDFTEKEDQSVKKETLQFTNIKSSIVSESISSHKETTVQSHPDSSVMPKYNFYGKKDKDSERKSILPIDEPFAIVKDTKCLKNEGSKLSESEMPKKTISLISVEDVEGDRNVTGIINPEEKEKSHSKPMEKQPYHLFPDLAEDYQKHGSSESKFIDGSTLAGSESFSQPKGGNLKLTSEVVLSYSESISSQKETTVQSHLDSSVMPKYNFYGKKDKDSKRKSILPIDEPFAIVKDTKVLKNKGSKLSESEMPKKTISLISVEDVEGDRNVTDIINPEEKEKSHSKPMEKQPYHLFPDLAEDYQKHGSSESKFIDGSTLAGSESFSQPKGGNLKLTSEVVLSYSESISSQKETTVQSHLDSSVMPKYNFYGKKDKDSERKSIWPIDEPFAIVKDTKVLKNKGSKLSESEMPKKTTSLISVEDVEGDRNVTDIINPEEKEKSHSKPMEKQPYHLFPDLAEDYQKHGSSESKFIDGSTSAGSESFSQPKGGNLKLTSEVVLSYSESISSQKETTVQSHLDSSVMPKYNFYGKKDKDSKRKSILPIDEPFAIVKDTKVLKNKGSKLSESEMPKKTISLISVEDVEGDRNVTDIINPEEKEKSHSKPMEKQPYHLFPDLAEDYQKHGSSESKFIDGSTLAGSESFSQPKGGNLKLTSEVVLSYSESISSQKETTVQSHLDSSVMPKYNFYGKKDKDSERKSIWPIDEPFAIVKDTKVLKNKGSKLSESEMPKKTISLISVEDVEGDRNVTDIINPEEKEKSHSKPMEKQPYHLFPDLAEDYQKHGSSESKFIDGSTLAGSESFSQPKGGNLKLTSEVVLSYSESISSQKETTVQSHLDSSVMPKYNFYGKKDKDSERKSIWPIDEPFAIVKDTKVLKNKGSKLSESEMPKKTISLISVEDVEGDRNVTDIINPEEKEKSHSKPMEKQPYHLFPDLAEDYQKHGSSESKFIDGSTLAGSESFSQPKGGNLKLTSEVVLSYSESISSQKETTVQSHLDSSVMPKYNFYGKKDKDSERKSILPIDEPFAIVKDTKVLKNKGSKLSESEMPKKTISLISVEDVEGDTNITVSINPEENKKSHPKSMEKQLCHLFPDLAEDYQKHSLSESKFIDSSILAGSESFSKPKDGNLKSTSEVLLSYSESISSQKETAVQSQPNLSVRPRDKSYGKKDKRSKIKRILHNKKPFAIEKDTKYFKNKRPELSESEIPKKRRSFISVQDVEDDRNIMGIINPEEYEKSHSKDMEKQPYHFPDLAKDYQEHISSQSKVIDSSMLDDSGFFSQSKDGNLEWEFTSKVVPSVSESISCKKDTTDQSHPNFPVRPNDKFYVEKDKGSERERSLLEEKPFAIRKDIKYLKNKGSKLSESEILKKGISFISSFENVKGDRNITGIINPEEKEKSHSKYIEKQPCHFFPDLAEDYQKHISSQSKFIDSSTLAGSKSQPKGRNLKWELTSEVVLSDMKCRSRMPDNAGNLNDFKMSTEPQNELRKNLYESSSVSSNLDMKITKEKNSLNLYCVPVDEVNYKTTKENVKHLATDTPKEAEDIKTQVVTPVSKDGSDDNRDNYPGDRADEIFKVTGRYSYGSKYFPAVAKSKDAVTEANTVKCLNKLKFMLDIAGVKKSLLEVSSVTKTKGFPCIAKNEDVPIVAKNEDVPIVAKNEDVPIVAKNEDVPSIAKNEDVPSIAKNEDVPSIAKNEDVPVVAKSEDVHTVAQTKDFPSIDKTIVGSNRSIKYDILCLDDGSIIINKDANLVFFSPKRKLLRLSSSKMKHVKKFSYYLRPERNQRRVEANKKRVKKKYREKAKEFSKKLAKLAVSGKIEFDFYEHIL